MELIAKQHDCKNCSKGIELGRISKNLTYEIIYKCGLQENIRKADVYNMNNEKIDEYINLQEASFYISKEENYTEDDLILDALSKHDIFGNVL